jgi:myo-inositol-1(or 4)-monophosphatase
MFTATLRGGAWLNGERISASTRHDPQGATLLANRFALDPALWPGGVPPMQRHFRSSLAYRMALVAQGRFDAMVTLRETWEWDIAAGSLIATEAGAALSDRTGATIRFDNPRPTVSGLVAGARAVHSDLVARIDAR